MSRSEHHQGLESQPRVALGHWPTPLQLLPRLSEELQGPRIWLKRDDCSGLATGGNKTRKLEYLLGAAQAEQADSIVTFGAVQSNHARQTAAAAAQVGLPCHLLLTRQVPKPGKLYEQGGNPLLNRLLGAETQFFAADAMDELRAALNAVRNAGQPYVIPAGGSNATGALGYIRAARELYAQCADLDIELSHVFHASSSAGTQAGLLAGFAEFESAPRVTGFNVYHGDPAKLINRIQSLLKDIHLTYPWTAQPADEALVVNHAYFGEGYGLPTPETLEAIRMAARMEGVLFDPVYSGKALAGLIDQINVGALQGVRDVVLIHTGGAQALNVYGDVL